VTKVERDGTRFSGLGEFTPRSVFCDGTEASFTAADLLRTAGAVATLP
jgi:hypothetical protein